ncbi:nuclear exosome regulator NRDE2 [Phymastichus coffea]|uniref:nuclear exosome regulator NRDE2 n=1 Tax=Phymastichus coffea TaxID=108790 RepID=UPI00273A9BFD|nr:nuclear exosome regulator NRDE2 [Phymastichus coffea]
MSLFAAFAKNTSETSCQNTEKSGKDTEKLPWLKNSSAQQISECLEKSNLQDVWSDSSDENFVGDSNKEIENITDLQKSNVSAKIEVKYDHNKKTKHKKKTCSKKYETHVKDIYFEDKERNKRLCTMETLDRGIRPSYSIFDKGFGFPYRKKGKKIHYRRYYKIKSDKSKKQEKKENEDEDSESEPERSKNYTHLLNSIDLDNQKLLIENFNQMLTQYPSDIQTWLEYISFQDQTIQISPFQSEREKLQQLVRQKKLSIVEKALALNNDSVDLLKMKLKILSELMPTDQYTNEIESMIQKDPKNIILWETLVTVIQTSCALFKISRVLNLYEKSFAVLKKNRNLNSKLYDKQILALLYQCLMLLRHAGLWEQMWEIIKINICLNLTVPQESFQNIKTFDEKTVMTMEELILSTRLPSNQLWLKIESLRECCHWIGLDVTKVDISLVGDEKRLVSAEETADFIYPIISNDSNFLLAIISIICLKVPLLPSRDSTFRDFNLDKHNWIPDSLEFILPMIYPSIGVCDVDARFSNLNVVKELLEGKLSAGPPLLKYHPSQEFYFEFVRLVFNTIAQELPPLQRTSILVWWLRFERLLIYISKHDPLKEANRDKKLKSAIKSFLKKPENRENLHFYREYAMIEFELGSYDECIQMLKTLLESQDHSSQDIDKKGAIISLYRTAFEIIFNLNIDIPLLLKNVQPFITLLKNYVSNSFDCDRNLSITEILYNEILNFLKDSPIDETEDAFFLPNHNCDILICYAYLLLVQNNSIDTLNDIVELFDRCITHCGDCPRIVERFIEIKIVFLKICKDKVNLNNNILFETVREAYENFQNNFFFISLQALFESEQPFWKMNIRSKNLNIWYIIARCLAGRVRIAHMKNIESQEGYAAMVNKMLSFHTAVSKFEELQNCPLVWKFYMLLIQEHNLSAKKGEEIFYEAISQCPWNKNVYTCAAEIAPQVLSQIQDLIQEKELRIHITPEELDILRS